MRVHAAAIVTFVLALVGGRPAEGFTDGDFPDSAYDPPMVTTTGIASSTATTELEGGNPGAFRQIANDLEIFSSVEIIQLNSSFLWIPSVQGEVISAIASCDVKSFPAADAPLFGIGAVVKQGNTIHKLDLHGVSSEIDGFQAISFGDLVSQLPGVNWVDGPGITFGFWAFNSSTTAPYEKIGGIDNLRVDIEGGECDDGIDNDGDGLIDDEDPPCLPDGLSETAVFEPACDNAFDDDGDGENNYKKEEGRGDPGCESPFDDSENSPELVCDDGIDNDADGRDDFEVGPGGDPGCESILDDSEKSRDLVCDDGEDNDGDGRTDAFGYLDSPADANCGRDRLGTSESGAEPEVRNVVVKGRRRIAPDASFDCQNPGPAGKGCVTVRGFFQARIDPATREMRTEFVDAEVRAVGPFGVVLATAEPAGGTELGTRWQTFTFDLELDCKAFLDEVGEGTEGVDVVATVSTVTGAMAQAARVGAVQLTCQR